MKKFIAGTLVLGALASGPALAEQGFSAGASVGYSNVEIGDSGATIDFNDIGYKIFGSYMFGDNWGIEGGWVDFGNASENVFGTDIDISTDGFDLFAVGSLPMNESFDIFAKAGIFSWDVSGSVSGLGQGSDSGEDLALGLGGRYRSTSGFGLRAEYEWFDIQDTESAWMFSVGFEYAFK